MKPIISVVGKTKSGKTTLIERIIPELKERGYKVGTIKHDVHQFEIDHEGKDTYRMTQSGADTVVIASDKKLGMIKNISDLSLDKIAEWLFPDGGIGLGVDIIITEGYKRQDKPKIEVTRSGELLCSKDDNLIAVIDNTDRDVALHLPDDLKKIPCFGLNEIEKIVDLMEEEFLKK